MCAFILSGRLSAYPQIVDFSDGIRGQLLSNNDVVDGLPFIKMLEASLHALTECWFNTKANWTIMPRMPSALCMELEVLCSSIYSRQVIPELFDAEVAVGTQDPPDPALSVEIEAPALLGVRRFAAAADATLFVEDLLEGRPQDPAAVPQPSVPLLLSVGFDLIGDLDVGVRGAPYEAALAGALTSL